MNVYDLRPRGYCHGVMNALNIVKKVIMDETYPRPIYILGQIVHNQKISEAFSNHGVISLSNKDKTRLEMIEEIHSGTVIFTAHGISEQVIKRASEKGLTYLNATCRDVTKVHDEVKESLSYGYQVIYIGHKNHPEPEAILAIDPSIIFVETEKDVLLIPNDITKQIYVTNQTTLSLYDIDPIIELLKTKYPNLIFNNDVCKATTVRQQAVMKQPKVDLMLVVGDILSSNSNKLALVGEKNQNIKSYLISGIEDIKLSWLENIESVSVTSGASTPTKITEEVIDFLRKYDKNDPTTWDQTSKLTWLDIL